MTGWCCVEASPAPGTACRALRGRAASKGSRRSRFWCSAACPVPQGPEYSAGSTTRMSYGKRSGLASTLFARPALKGSNRFWRASVAAGIILPGTARRFADHDEAVFLLDCELDILQGQFGDHERDRVHHEELVAAGVQDFYLPRDGTEENFESGGLVRGISDGEQLGEGARCKVGSNNGCNSKQRAAPLTGRRNRLGGTPMVRRSQGGRAFWGRGAHAEGTCAVL